MVASPSAEVTKLPVPSLRAPQRTILAGKPPTCDGWLFEFELGGENG
jgi:hypothetical protein